MDISYLGKAYNGWQVQPDAPSVQQALQEALSVILRRKTETVGAGRTDTGVHASRYTAHFDTDEPIEEAVKFCYHLNAVLPEDISALSLRRVRDDAHARFDAHAREYRYYVVRNKNPFATDTAYRVTIPLDVAKMNEAAAMLLKQEDFTSFCKLHSGNKTNICHVTRAEWHDEGDFLIFTVSADRFLRNMVRALVGTLLDVGRGKITVDDFRSITEGRDRGLAGGSAPAHGLFFTRADYPAAIYIVDEH